MGSLLVSIFLFAPDDPLAAARARMVAAHIESRGVRNREVLAAMRATPRHLFLPQDMWPHAYEDRPLPIAHGQTISQPFIVASMSELLGPSPKARVLEIGTGSGYQAAVLAQLFGEVYSIEIVPQLARSAEAVLKRLRAANVRVRTGDGYAGWPEEAPFDRILLTAAPPEIPEALLKQLAPGGRLVAPVGADPEDQQLVVVEKSREGKLTRRVAYPVRFVPMVKGR